jgi:hypothetical protein
MHKIIATGRRMGKSTLMNKFMREQAEAMQKSIDRMIIDELWSLPRYRVNKTWTDRKGRKMHRIGANAEVREWLATEHSQYGVKNPDWWAAHNYINITDRLYTLLTLKWAE